MHMRIYALLVKEFLNLFKDKRSRFVLIVPPLVQLLVLSYAATFDLREAPIAIYDEDNSSESRELIARFTGAPAFRHALTIDNQAQIARVLESKQVIMVVHLGRHFSRDLSGGRQAARVQLLLDGRDSNTAQIALGYAQSVLYAFNCNLQRSSGARPMMQLTVRAWFNPNLESQWFVVPGIVGLLALVEAMIVTALSVAREREQGTFDQLLVTPLTPAEILLGKAIPGLVVGITEASVTILMVVFWFKVPLLGSLAALYLGIILYVFSAIGVGLMISSLSVTQQQGLLGGFLVMVPAIILSGFATPIANMPAPVQHLTLFNPLRYFLVIIRGVFLEGLGMHDLIDQYWPLGAIGLTCLFCAGWLFRRRLN